ncbi:hypothetical protein GRS48_10820 [Halorubrum sp. JWXQ-INN 858]|uniref:DUF7523 family protein n=1 Tax=Halorubrum sp. JWXQ-INN 858 TaxID=2690782 RepID=UPI0013598596|nr:hypothetical protein [Halorubrum sp. JWXQ-INN 858]MWV65307.1 hypothetical protein [Halorubrum sp. JWXQ-INN 858]
MSLAAAVREAVRERPFVRDALRAGLVNHAAAAEWLAADAGLDGDADAIATALRRFRADLPEYATAGRTATVSMRSGVGVVTAPASADEPLLTVGGTAVVPEGSRTAIVATGAVDPAALGAALGRLAAVEVAVAAAGVAGDTLLVVVERRDGATAVRTVEAALGSVPTDASEA